MQTRMEKGRGLPGEVVEMKSRGTETNRRKESLMDRGANENISCCFSRMRMRALKDPELNLG